MIVGLCGNPNVGKSTLFNRLTGLRQHTGNWPGKTVDSAVGRWGEHTLVDTPGSYSLSARSAEEEVTRDYILFGGAERLILVVDGCDLRRGLLLALQVLELRGDVILCVNLMDEAARRGISVDACRLSALLGIPVLPMNAAAGVGTDMLEAALHAPVARRSVPRFPPQITAALAPLESYLGGQPLPAQWLARSLLAGDGELRELLARKLCLDPARDTELASLLAEADAALGETVLEDEAACALAAAADDLCNAVLHQRESGRPAAERRIDRIRTHRLWGIPSMLVLLALVLWLTMKGANLPSDYLSR